MGLNGVHNKVVRSAAVRISEAGPSGAISACLHTDEAWQVDSSYQLPQAHPPLASSCGRLSAHCDSDLGQLGPLERDDSHRASVAVMGRRTLDLPTLGNEPLTDGSGSQLQVRRPLKLRQMPVQQLQARVAPIQSAVLTAPPSEPYAAACAHVNGAQCFIHSSDTLPEAVSPSRSVSSHPDPYLNSVSVSSQLLVTQAQVQSKSSHPLEDCRSVDSCRIRDGDGGNGGRPTDGEGECCSGQQTLSCTTRTPLERQIGRCLRREATDGDDDGCETKRRRSALQRTLTMEQREAVTGANDEFLKFDDEPNPEPASLLVVVSSIALIELVMGACLSLGFLAVAKFPPAGYDGSSSSDHMLCRVGQFLAIVPSAYVFMLFEPKLISLGWWAYYTSWNGGIYVGLRSLIEWSTGSSKSLMLTYVLLTLTGYPVVLPVLPALHKLYGYSTWHSPWTWTKASMRRSLDIHEIKFFICSLSGSFAYICYTAVDELLYADASKVKIPKWINRLTRPILGLVVSTLARRLICYGCSASRSVAVKTSGLLCMLCILNLVPVRISTAAVDDAAFLFSLLVNWFAFTYQSAEFFTMTSEPTERPDESRFFVLFRRHCLRVDLSKMSPPAGMDKNDYRGFEYMVQVWCALLSAAILFPGRAGPLHKVARCLIIMCC